MSRLYRIRPLATFLTALALLTLAQLGPDLGLGTPSHRSARPLPTPVPEGDGAYPAPIRLVELLAATKKCGCAAG